MEDQIVFRFTLGYGLFEGGNRCGLSRHLIADHPADDRPIRQVQYDGEVVPLVIDLEAGDVADPLGGRSLRREVAT
jgi:hypothetical protein